jgi:starch phosphorylase
MARLTPRYSSERMMREYMDRIYRPAARAYRRRSADGARLAGALAEWQERLNDSWKELRLGEMNVAREGEMWSFSVEAYLGELLPDDVRMELYADPLPQKGPGAEEEGRPERIEMQRLWPLAGAVNGFVFGAKVAAARAAEDYTPRIVPYHPEAFVPMEERHILWMR